jgi:hypothetical protein
LVELASGGLDVLLTWNKSMDDGGGEDDVVGYSVYRSSNGVNGLYEFADWIEANGSISYSWTDSNAGDGDLNDYFYIVRANDTLGIEEQNQNKVGKVSYNLQEGFNLISVSLEQTDTTRDVVLQTVAGNYAALQGYHAGESTPWLHWQTDKPNPYNDIIEVYNKIGFYIDLIGADDLVVVGNVPQTSQISLKTGWNLIGYPSLEIRPRDTALASISGLYNKVELYNTATGVNEALGSNDPMEPGQGYWIHATQDCDLII